MAFDFTSERRDTQRMNQFENVLLGAHILAGLAAMATGLVPIVTRKGGSVHTAWGRGFAYFMTLGLGSAAALTLLSANRYFAALTASATLLTISSLRVLRRKRPDLSAADRARPIDWLVALGALAVAALVLSMPSQPSARSNPIVVRALVTTIIVVGGYDLLRFLRPNSWPFFPRLWFYEHLVKMVAAYSAVVSAFSGSVALRFLPDPWKQLWATPVFGALTIAMIAYHAARDRKRGSRSHASS